MDTMIDMFLQNAKQAVVRGKTTLNTSVDVSSVNMVREHSPNTQNKASGYRTGTNLPTS